MSTSRIEQLVSLLKEMTFDEMREVASALRDRLRDNEEPDHWLPYANALEDFAGHHFQEDGDA